MSMVLTASAAADFRQRIESEGKRLVLTNGCFDLLHAGHVRYLTQARALGDALLVAVNSDRSVRMLKGAGRPVNTEADRTEVLAALRSVDAVTVFDDKRLTDLIGNVRPHVYAKGGDYTIETLDPGERAALEQCGAVIEILPLVSGRSTTEILRGMERASERTKHL